MNPTIQPGMHPDADSLTAFAEQLLPNREREQILAHMATCSRCREVVFLAQQAGEAEPATASLKASAPPKLRASWLGGWRRAWVPAGALAALIGIAVVVHFRRVETEKQMAANVTDTLQRATPAQTASSPAPAATQANAVEKAKSSPKQTSAPMRGTKGASGVVEEQRVVRQQGSALGKAAPPIVSPPGVAGGAIHGTFAALAKTSPIGGPMARQIQQQNVVPQQSATSQQDLLRQAQNLNQTAADKRVIAGAPLGGVAETVSVQAPTEAAPAPQAPAAQLSYIPMSGKDLGLSSAAAGMKKIPKILLPNGAQALSMASAETRIVAIDTSGALFLSEDNGRHWQPIPTQWMGRAVLVRNLPGGTKTTALQAVPPTRFELVNDKLQTWMSIDGKTWTAENLPGK